MALRLIIQRRLPQLGVAGLLRNARPDWIGIGGRFESEWVADLRRNTHLTFNDKKGGFWLEDNAPGKIKVEDSN